MTQGEPVDLKTPRTLGPALVRGSSRGSRGSGSVSKYSQGWGVIANTGNNGSAIDAADVTEACSYSYVDHVQCDFYWSVLQPTANTGLTSDYVFDTVDDNLAIIKAAGKRMVFGLVTCPNPAIPSWYFTNTYEGTPVAAITSATKTYFLLWDAVYKARMLRLFDAIQARYGTEPGIEAFKGVGLAAGTYEPSMYGGDNDDATVKTACIANGQVYVGDEPTFDSDSPYTQVVDYLTRAWADRFSYHAALSTVHFPNEAHTDYELDVQMRSTAESLGLVSVNTGLNEADKTTARTYFDLTRTRGCWRTGWGGVTGIGSTDADWYEAMREGFGGSFPEGDYLPEGRSSYMTVNVTSLPARVLPVQYGRALLERN